MTAGQGTVRAALAELRGRLAEAGVPAPDIDATLLLRHVLGWSQVRLVTGAGEQLPAAARDRLALLVERRAAREPLQLLVGFVGFRHLEIAVRPGVFVPRPETEVLAGEAIARTPHGGVVVEPCTGTGAVACALADESGAGTVVAADVSREAVALARHNASAAALDVQVVEGDLLAPVPPGLRGRVDVLVCNPPYLAEAELPGLEPEVRDHDPVTALVAGPTGHEVTDRLLAEAPDWLRPGGWLLLETADIRAVQTAERARGLGYTEVAVLPDLAGRDRIVLGRRP